MTDDLPRFPDILPDKIEKGRLRYIEDGVFESVETFSSLLDLLWREPHIKTYLFSCEQGGMNHFVLSAEMIGTIQCGATESRWYKHPNFKDDFIRIKSATDWDWEKVVVATQPMYLRTQVSLSDKERRRRELAEALAEFRPSPPSTIWGKIKVHYTENQAWYNFGALIVTVAAFVLAFFGI